MFYIGIAQDKNGFRAAVLKKEKQGASVQSVHCFPSGPESVFPAWAMPM